MSKEVVSATKKFYQRKAIYTWTSVAVLFLVGSLFLFSEETRIMSVVLFLVGTVLLASAGPGYRK